MGGRNGSDKYQLRSRDQFKTEGCNCHESFCLFFFLLEHICKAGHSGVSFRFQHSGSGGRRVS